MALNTAQPLYEIVLSLYQQYGGIIMIKYLDVVLIDGVSHEVDRVMSNMVTFFNLEELDLICLPIADAAALEVIGHSSVDAMTAFKSKASKEERAAFTKLARERSNAALEEMLKKYGGNF
jgi:CobQ-like glutamine amidotransferase family enzyme